MPLLWKKSKSRTTSRKFIVKKMRIISWNVNGIRAAIRKGLNEFITKMNPDILMLQEIRCLEEQLPKDWGAPLNLSYYWHPAEKKGYSGVATFSNKSFETIEKGKGTEDPEGRILVTKHDNLILINTYLPSGSSKVERQLFKEKWMDEYLNWSLNYVDLDCPVIIAGDLNIAHTENDIWNPSGNKNTSGFLPNEREWFNKLLNLGWVDICREKFGEKKGPYSWWSNRGRARILDRGWRIDYFLANKPAVKLISHAEINREGGLIVSDHAPVIIDLNL
ncbi:MAG: exodeoxyribonuclease III [Methanobacteriota archaeon]|nr:MAG: exodeoxyribonuclease III [Euryarchaeota archaeon]